MTVGETGSEDSWSWLPSRHTGGPCGPLEASSSAALPIWTTYDSAGRSPEAIGCTT